MITPLGPAVSTTEVRSDLMCAMSSIMRGASGVVWPVLSSLVAETGRLYLALRMEIRESQTDGPSQIPGTMKIVGAMAL